MYSVDESTIFIGLAYQVKVLQTCILEAIVYRFLDATSVMPWKLRRHENICTWNTRCTDCLAGSALSS
jgi:hypothetical protein